MMSAAVPWIGGARARVRDADGDVLFATSAWLADYILERFPAEGPASA